MYHVTDSSLSLSGFHARLQARADFPQRDMPDDHPPDPDDIADFELPDQQALIDAFTAGLFQAIQIFPRNDATQNMHNMHNMRNMQNYTEYAEYASESCIYIT
jgi:hypothetical protein